MIHHIKTSTTASPDSSADDQAQMPDRQADLVVKGYPKLARLMHDSPKATILRSFTELRLTNLLRMQAELHWLEKQLAIARMVDAKSEDGKLQSCSFKELRENVSVQQEILEEINLKLERYENALLRMTKLRKLQRPSERDFKSLQLWLEADDGGDSALVAPEHNIWKFSLSEYISLADFEQRDIFSEMMYGGILDLYHRLWGGRKEKGPSKLLREYDDKKIDQLSDATSAVVSSLLPTLAILVLYFVKSLLIKIVLVVVFTGLFSCLLSIFTEAIRIEVFSATAAFAAVVVVFVSNGAPDNGSKS
ncbi:hypothetical protein KCU93_g5415, partial [Aureobasidium melanogenum]